MGYPTQQQKVDYLFKKLGFTKAKTGVAEDQTSGFSGDTKKAPPNEAISSPLIVPATSVWADTSYIPATPPNSSDGYVGVYKTTSAFQMTVDTTVSNNRSFIARDTWGNPASAIKGDWIDTQFGADYLIKVYKGDPSTGAATKILSAAGTSGKDDVWFFDYSSGILNFNGEDIDGQLSGITTSNIYIVGYRYLGTKGIQPPAGIGTFNNLYVSGVSTFVGNAYANSDVQVGGTLSVTGISTFNGNVYIPDSTAASPSLRFGSDEDFKVHHDGSNAYLINDTGQLVFKTPDTAIKVVIEDDGLGIAETLYHLSDKNTNLKFPADDTITLTTAGTERFRIRSDGNINIVNALNVTGIATFAADIDANADVDIAANLAVAGVSTFTGAIDANGDLDVDGRAELDNVNISETLNVVGVSTFGDDINLVGSGSSVRASWAQNANRLRFNDDTKVRFGTGNSGLNIWHGETHSYIENSGGSAGDLYVRAQSNNKELHLEAGGGVEILTDGTKKAIIANQPGDVEIYHNDSLRIETTEYGALFYGGQAGIGTIAGPATFHIDPASVGDNTGTVVIKGNLQVDGTQTTVNSSTMDVADKNVGIASGAANDAAADGAGITVYSGDGNKTWNWVDATDAWTSSEHIQVAAGKQLGFADDTNTYVDRPAVDKIRFTTGGSERLIVTNDGINVAGVSTFSSDINLPDNISVLFGTDEDGVIKHTGANLQIQETTGNIQITNYANDLDVDISSDDGSGGTTNYFKADGSTGEAILYNYGNERIRTTGTGVTITDTLSVAGVSTFNANVQLLDNDKLLLGGAVGSHDGLELYHDTSNSYIADTGTGSLIIKGADVEIQTAGGNKYFTGAANVAKLYHTNLEKLSTKGWGIDVTGTLDTDQLKVSGISTFTGNIDANAGLDVDGTSDLDQVNIAQGLNVTAGIATFAGDIDANADMELAGNLAVTGVSTFTGISTFSSTVVSQKSVQIEENLNVTGVTTFNGAITLPPGTGGNFGNINIAVTGNNEIDTDAGTGNLILDSAGGTINVDDGLTVAGVSTFTGASSFSSGATFEGTIIGAPGIDLQLNGNVITSGITTLGVTTATNLTLQQLNVSGVSTFSDDVTVDADLTVNNLNVRDNGTGNPTVLIATDDQNPSAFRIKNDTYHSNTSTGFSISQRNTGAFHITGKGNSEFVPVLIRSQDGSSTKELLQWDAAGNATFGYALSVAGVSTFTGAIDANGDLDVDGRSELDNVNIAETLNVAGITTFNVDTGFIGGGAGITSAYWDQSAASFKFLDNVKAQFGDSQDLSIWHNGANSFIEDSGTGALYIDTNHLYFRKYNTSDVLAMFQSDASVQLFHSGTKRLETTGTGVDITDNLNVAGVSTFVGETNIGTGGTVFTALVGAAASVGIGSATPDYMLDVAGAINSETDVKVQGVSISDTALNDAVAMAIALG